MSARYIHVRAWNLSPGGDCPEVRGEAVAQFLWEADQMGLRLLGDPQTTVRGGHVIVAALVRGGDGLEMDEGIPWDTITGATT